MSRFACLLVLLTIAGCSKPAPEVTVEEVAYEIKYREWLDSETVAVKVEDSSTITNTFTINGMKEEVPETIGSTYEYNDVTLKREPGQRPVKARRIYKKAERRDNGVPSEVVFANNTVLIEKVNDRYVFRIEGGNEITGEDLRHFAETYNQSLPANRQELFPDQPVKLHEVWTVPKETALRSFQPPEGITIDPDSIMTTGRLVRVYPKGKAMFGVIELNTEVKYIGANDVFGSAGSKLQPGGSSVIDMTLDICIDGTVSDWKMTGTNRLRLVIVPPPGDDSPSQIEMKIDGKTSVQERNHE